MDSLRIRARIDLDAISANIRRIKQITVDSSGRVPAVYAVVKADAYGHGVLPIARHLSGEGSISGFAVATFEEAIELYDDGIRLPIIILGYTFRHVYKEVARLGIRPTIFTREMAEAYQSAAKSTGCKVYAHIKIDTGMGRIGYAVNEKNADEIAALFRENKELIPEGIFTHFARADEKDKQATDAQLSAFNAMRGMLSERGVTFSMTHASNSAAILEYKDAYFDAVRAGIIIYGMMPSDEVGEGYGLVPALSLHSHIVYIKEVEAGTPISYGGTFVTDRKSRIATIPVGYGDGYPRGLSGKGAVLIRGKRARILGRVCMDQCMVDVTDIPDASIMDEVTLLGRDGDEVITIEELGELSGRFNYEFACGLGNRIPRLYYSDGELVDIKEYY